LASHERKIPISPGLGHLPYPQSSLPRRTELAPAALEYRIETPTRHEHPALKILSAPKPPRIFLPASNTESSKYKKRQSMTPGLDTMTALISQQKIFLQMVHAH
jgi:hypothetical protein